jgi:RimJ/RimL family protein N-acetyltransferase
MVPHPTIATTRLVLRPFTLADIPELVPLVGDANVASTTLLIPHPYTAADGERWISGHAAAREKGESLDWAICQRDGRLMGAIGMVLRAAHDRAEIGYWIGKPFWGQGYATEAANGLLGFGFGTLNLHRIEAYHYARNPASGRVLEKVGMEREGVSRGKIKKWGAFEDCVLYGIVREEWEARGQPGANNRR